MKTIVVMVAANLASALGDSFMSAGMKQVGDVSAMGQAWKLLTMFGNRSVLLSIACAVIYFFLYSSALSWADLSYAQPMNALTFVFAALIARFALHEHISGRRWLGIGVIVVGLLMLTWDQRPETPPSLTPQ